MEHFSCFPDVGKFKVHGLMVKKKSFFYHLSDSMAIKHVLKELSGTWLLHHDASSSSMQNVPKERSSAPFTSKLALSDSSPCHDNPSQKSVSLDDADLGRFSLISNESPTRNNAKSGHNRKNLKKRNIIEHNNIVEANKWIKTREVKSAFAPGFNTEHQPNTVSEDPIEGKEHESSSILETSRKSTQTISVTAIISKFFSELDEVPMDELRDSKIRTSALQPDHISSRKSVVSDTDTECSFAEEQQENTAERANVVLMLKKQQLGSRSKSCKYEVGKRLIQAANSIQIAGNGKRSATKFLSKFKNLTSSDSAFFASRNAFDADDFAD